MTALAMIQFGAKPDVTTGFSKMCDAKVAEGIEVRFIDALNMTEEDHAFLQRRDLKQINFISHSLHWQPYSDILIPSEQRYIGDATLGEAIAITEELSRKTHARKFNFYSCEIGDKFLSNDMELRDIIQTLEEGGRVRTVDLTHRPLTFEGLQRFIQHHTEKSEEYVSSFDLLVCAIARGKMCNPHYTAYTPIECGGQVSMGDPENDSNLGSPRISMRREDAHPYQETSYTRKTRDLPSVQRADENNQGRLNREHVAGRYSIAWDRRFFSLCNNGERRQILDPELAPFPLKKH